MYFPIGFIKDGQAEALAEMLMSNYGGAAVIDANGLAWDIDPDYIDAEDVKYDVASYFTAGVVLIFEDRDATGAGQFTGFRLDADGTWTTLVTRYHVSFADPVTGAEVHALN